jgi:hypothetical protein
MRRATALIPDAQAGIKHNHTRQIIRSLWARQRAIITRLAKGMAR